MTKNKINIAFVTHGERNTGGGEHNWELMISKLNKTLFNPIVFVKNQNFLVKNLKKNNITIKSIDIDDRISSLFRDQVRFNPISAIKYVYFLSLSSWKLFHLLKLHQIKILHVHDNLSKLIGIPAAKFSGVKIMTHCRDQLGNELIEKILLNVQKIFMDRVVCVSKFVGSRFSSNDVLPKNISVVYNGIDLEKWDPKTLVNSTNSNINRDDIVMIGIVALLDKVKGHVHLLEAIKILKERGVKNLFCKIIGNGREEKFLQEWVKQNKIEKYISFEGFLPYPEVKNSIHKLDILIIPSLREALPGVAMQGMAMKKPIIASNVGGLPELIDDGNTGILVPSANPGKLADAIKYLIDNPNLREKMGLVGNNRVRRLFDINKNLRITEKIIHSLAYS